MNPTKGDVTRYLAASALQQGILFRRKLLDYVDKKHAALAPDLGVDLPFLIRICKYFEKRDTKYSLAFVGISIIFLPVAAILSALSNIAGIIILYVLLLCVDSYKGYVEHKWLTTLFQRDKYDPEAISKRFNLKDDAATSSANARNDQNLIIYSGFIPFVGAGIDLGGWSFAIDFSKPREDLGQSADILAFTIKDLYEELDNSLKELKFEGLKNQDVLLVNGSDIRDEKWILPDIYGQPVSKVDAETIKRFIDSNDMRIRHYKWIQIYDWGNDLVVSYYLRCSRRGKNLFVEVSVFLLTPIADRYRSVDALVPDHWLQPQTIAWLLSKTPFTLIYSWFSLFFKFFLWLKRRFGNEERQLRERIKNNSLYNYGADNSLRVIMGSQGYRHYFQYLDKEMYVKILNRELLDAIVRFLDKHNIDTSDLKQRQTTIINSGIMVQGGDVRAQTMAVGSGAKAATETKEGGKVPLRKK